MDNEVLVANNFKIRTYAFVIPECLCRESIRPLFDERHGFPPSRE